MSSFLGKKSYNPCIVVYICNRSTWEAKARDQELLGGNWSNGSVVKRGCCIVEDLSLESPHQNGSLQSSVTTIPGDLNLFSVSNGIWTKCSSTHIDKTFIYIKKKTSNPSCIMRLSQILINNLEKFYLNYLLFYVDESCACIYICVQAYFVSTEVRKGRWIP